MDWGLDAGDQSVTGNRVCIDTYLAATEAYIAYCSDNGYSTKVVFTTVPYDTEPTYEAGYQHYLKNEYIRNYVKANTTRILFDYADILAYEDNGALTTREWNGHTYPFITATNLSTSETFHISTTGAIRLAKAQW